MKAVFDCEFFDSFEPQRLSLLVDEGIHALSGMPDHYRMSRKQQWSDINLFESGL